jgi:hypothetical protein
MDHIYAWSAISRIASFPLPTPTRVNGYIAPVTTDDIAMVAMRQVPTRNGKVVKIAMPCAAVPDLVIRG